MDYNIAIILIVLFVLSVFFYKIRMEKQQDEIFTRGQTTAIKGMAIIVIVIHHLVQTMSNQSILIPFRGIGYLFVTMFLVFSGWGLCYQYQVKENYLHDFCKKRLLKIYSPFFFMNVIYFIYNYFIYNNKPSVFEIFSSVFMGTEDVTMWYIRTAIFWYIIFYILFKFVKSNKNKTIHLIVISCLYFIFCNLAGLSKNNFDISFAFAIGVILCLYKKRIMAVIVEKKYIFITTLILFCISFLLSFGKSDLLSVSIRTLSSVLFAILTIICSVYIDFSKNKIAAFIGSISFEMYLIHYKIITELNKVMSFGVLYVIVLALSIFVSSYLLNLLIKCIKNRNVGTPESVQGIQ